MKLSFQNIFFATGSVFALFAILVIGRSVLIPLSFALLFSFILFPLVKKYESWGINRIISAFLAIFTIFLLFGGVIYFFSTQIVQMSEEFSDFKEKIFDVFAQVTSFVNKNVSIVPELGKNELTDQVREWLTRSSGTLVKKTFNNTTAFLAGLLTAIIFTFLILIYRHGLTQAFVHFYPEEKRPKALNMFKAIQQVGQQYLFGMLLIMIILGLINSFGLWIIGIDYPFLFGFLAAVLAIIPYVGTTIGASIPVLYAFVTYDSIWVALITAFFFWFVQLIEGNFLSPKIVGGSLKVNALVAILSIIIGAAVWGIAGMILFLPFIAMLKVMCQEYDSLQPIAMIIGEQSEGESEGGMKTIKKWLGKLKGQS